jgi:3-hydroxymyristoyl/3-hydroxydecanoyl-(acyl carrier protein) dehydratase
LKLPHRYPFRFIDRTTDGRALLRLTANGAWSRGCGGAPVAWLVEAIAQGAALVLAPEGAGEERRLALAAIEEARPERPPEPGETVEVEVSLEARWGALVRVRGRLSLDGTPLGGAVVVLAEI